MAPSIFEILLLKVWATFMLLGSSVLWFVFIRDLYQQKKDFRLWCFFAMIVGGLLIAFLFMDAWRPLPPR